MKPARAMLGVGDSLIDRALCVVGAVLFSQAPEFMQQYLQRLGGHLDEARRHLQQFQAVAAQSGLTLDRLITQTNANPDPAVAKLGGVMTDAASRVETLAAAQGALEHATMWSRPFVFLRNVDVEIARSTWGVFKPAIPSTIEGLLYASFGMLTLLVIYHWGVKYPIRRARERRAARIGAKA